MDPALEAARALEHKYREMLALRIEHARGETADPRPRLRALARRFPGALRELDELPLETIEARLRALQGALARAAEVPAWVTLQDRYHAVYRAALVVKRLARGRRGSALQEVVRELAERGPIEADRLDPSAVAAILDPPGGRLGPWVLEVVAVESGATPAEVHRALFLRRGPDDDPHGAR